jgi:hypothetical protein
MQKYSDLVLSVTGVPLRGAAVTVKTYPGGVLATIYSDNALTPAANPLTSDVNGRYSFYAADGRYSLDIAAAGFATQTISDVLLEDPADGSTALAAPTGATLIGYLAPGTGAIARTLSSVLGALAFSGDYSSVANFNTAQAARTETVGVATIRIGTGNDAGEVFPSRAGQVGSAYGDFYCHGGGATFNGQFDPTWGDGYNVGRPLASEPQFDRTIEGHYYDGSKHWIEVNWQFVSTSGVVTRVFGMQINRNNPAETVWAYAGSQFRIESVINAAEFTFLTAAAGVTLSLGLGDLGATSRTAVVFRNGGFAAPSNANSTSNGDKTVLFNGSTIKVADGIDTGTRWFQCNGSDAAAFKWYGGNAAGPVVHMTLASSTAALTVLGGFGCNGAAAQAASTGYGTPTNAAKQASFDATAITLPNLAKAVGQLIIDLKAVGFLAA